MSRRISYISLYFIVLLSTVSCFLPLALTPTEIISSTLPIHLLWQVELKDAVVQKPILHKNILLVLTSKALYAIEQNSGKILWRRDTVYQRMHFPLVVNDDIVALGDSSGYLTVLDLKTGHVRWQLDVGGDESDYVSDVVVKDEVVYVVGQDTFIEARYVETGKLIWDIDGLDALSVGISSRGVRLIVQDDKVYIIGTEVHIADVKTGEIVDVKDINIGKGQVVNHIMYHANHAYKLPTFTVIAEYKSPTFKEVYGNCILFRTPLEIRGDIFYAPGYCGGVFAVDLAGKILWEYEPALDAESPVALFHENVYALLSNGQIHAIDAVDGKNRGSLTTNGTIPGLMVGDLSARGITANESVLIATFGNRQVWAFGD